MNDEYGYVKFLGDYSKLKSMGFTFQKLYANNYMQWSKDGFRIWKKGGDITHDDYNLFKLIRFMRTNPVMRTWDSNPNGNRGEKTYSFYKFYSDPDENIYDYYPADEENRQKYLDNMHLYSEAGGYDENNPPPYLGDSICIGQKQLDFLQELNKMGWYELAYYPED